MVIKFNQSLSWFLCFAVHSHSKTKVAKAQHKRDVALLYGYAVHFGCGYVTKNKGINDTTSNTYMWRVRKNEDLCNIIIPFFNEYKLQTQKAKEFEVFAKLCFLLRDKHHLTPEGHKQCLEIARQLQGMRKIF